MKANPVGDAEPQGADAEAGNVLTVLHGGAAHEKAGAIGQPDCMPWRVVPAKQTCMPFTMLVT